MTKPNDWGPDGRYPNMTADERLITAILWDQTAGDPPDGWLVLTGEFDEQGVRSSIGPFDAEVQAVLYAEHLRVEFEADEGTAGGLIKVVPLYSPREQLPREGS